jgi:hypothetical protein
LIIDYIQLFFCCCTASKLIFIKLPQCFKKKDEEGNEVEIEIEGYSKVCSMAVDFFVIVLFLFKFALSQITNYNDIEGILVNNFNGHNKEEYVDLVSYADYYLQ